MTADAHKTVENATSDGSGGGILNSIDSTKIAIGLAVVVGLAAVYVIYQKRSDGNGGTSTGEDGGDDGGTGEEVEFEGEAEEEEVELADNPSDPLENDERILEKVAS